MRPRVRESGVCGTGSSARRSARYESINVFNPLELRGNYTLSATSNNIQLVHWPSIGGLLHLVQQWGEWAEPQPAQAPPRCTKCNTAHPSTASVPIAVLLYNGLLLCGFNPFDCKGNYSATSINTKLVHWPWMNGLLHLVQRGETCTI